MGISQLIFRIKSILNRIKYGFKRMLIGVLLKINRSRQRQGTSIFSTRHGFTLFSKVIYFLSRIDNDVDVGMQTVDGIYGIRAIPPNKSSKVIFYIYGGSFVLGLEHIKRAYLPFAARLAKDTQAEVWIPSYRTSPEYAYPVPGEDCLANYLRLLKRGVKPENVSIMGAGSGAALALGLVMTLRDHGHPLPDSVATISAWTDLALTGHSLYMRSDQDPMLSTSSALGYFNHYLQGASPREPMASPLYGDFEGLPRMYMIVGGREIFYDDTIRVYEKAKAAGVNITLDADEKMMYGYPIYFDIYPQGRDAIKRLATFVNEEPAVVLEEDSNRAEVS